MHTTKKCTDGAATHEIATTRGFWNTAKKVVLAIQLLVIWHNGGLAATYFVDFGSGNDGASGTSTDSPWRHCPGDPTALAVAKATLLRAGDVVKFKGGVIYYGEIKLTRSGTTTSPITYDGNDSGDWGTGRAIIDGAYSSAKRSFRASASVGGITIKGFEIRNVGGYPDNHPILATTSPLVTQESVPNGIAMDFSLGGNKDIRLENLYLHRIGQWRNQLPFSGGNCIKGLGIWLVDAQRILIKDCEFTKIRTPVSLQSKTVTKNIEIDSCHFHDYFVWGIDITPVRLDAALSDINIHDTIFRDYHQYDLGNWAAAGECPHSNGIFLRTNGTRTSWTRINIFNCDFYTDYPGNTKWGGTASISIGHGPSVNIFNNVFNSDRHSRVIGVIGLSAASNRQVIRIYNNTFISGPTHLTISGETDPTKREIHVENNAFFMDYNGSGINYIMINYMSGTFPKLLDYNIYFDPWFGELQRYVLKSGTAYHRLGKVKSLGFENQGGYIDPGFYDLTPTRPSQDDVRLKEGSNAIGRGKNLSAYFQTDKAGYPRPATGAWDIGAYSYQATSISMASPAPPSALRVVEEQ